MVRIALRDTAAGRTHKLELSSADAPWSELTFNILQKTGKTVGRNWKLELNHPPQKRQIYSKNALEPVSFLGIRPDDLLILSPVTSNSQMDIERSDCHEMFVQEIPDDNSCLFNAIGFLFENGHQTSGHSKALRSIVANVIISDPSYYNEALLGRPPLDYVDWICRPNTWGGAIELSIFSTYYQTQIVSIDIKTLRQDIFGESNPDYVYRVFLLYSGVHYDAVSCRHKLKNELVAASDTGIVTKFLISDDVATVEALKLAEVLRAGHHYTDLSDFTLTCDVCGANFIGERQAQEHAVETGHNRFSEYTRCAY